MSFGPALCAITLMASVSPPRYGLVSPLHRGSLTEGMKRPVHVRYCHSAQGQTISPGL